MKGSWRLFLGKEVFSVRTFDEYYASARNWSILYGKAKIKKKNETLKNTSSTNKKSV